MSIEKINQAKAEISATSAYKTITAFFDADSFCEIDAFAKSGEGFAEVVAGFGTVCLFMRLHRTATFAAVL